MTRRIARAIWSQTPTLAMPPGTSGGGGAHLRVRSRTVCGHRELSTKSEQAAGWSADAPNASQHAKLASSSSSSSSSLPPLPLPRGRRASPVTVFPARIPVNARPLPPVFRPACPGTRQPTAALPRSKKSQHRLVPNTDTGRLMARLRQHVDQSSPAAALAGDMVPVEQPSEPTVAEVAFDALNRACDMFSSAGSPELQTRLADTLYTQLREHYADQPVLFARLMRRLIDVCAFHRRMDLAESVFARMHKHAGAKMLEARALGPYTTLAVLMCREHQLDKAEAVFRVAEVSGTALDAKAFNAAIVANAAAGRQSVAFNYLKRMMAAGWRPRVAPLNALVATQDATDASYSARVDQLLMMLDQLSAHPDGTLANGATFIHLLAQANTLEALETCWDQLLSRGLHRNAAVQRAFLTACLRLFPAADPTVDVTTLEPAHAAALLTSRQAMSRWQAMLGRFERRGVATAEAYRTLLAAYAQTSNAIGARVMAARLARTGHGWSCRDMRLLCHAFGRLPAHSNVDGNEARPADTAYLLHQHRVRLWRVWSAWTAQRMLPLSAAAAASGPAAHMTPGISVPVPVYKDMLAALGRVRDVRGLWRIWRADSRDFAPTVPATRLDKPSVRHGCNDETEDAHLLEPLRVLHTLRLQTQPVHTTVTFLHALRNFPHDALELWRNAPVVARADASVAAALLDTMTLPVHAPLLRPMLLALVQQQNALLEDQDRLTDVLVRALVRLDGDSDDSSRSSSNNSSNNQDTRAKVTMLPRAPAPAELARALTVARELAALLASVRENADVTSAARLLEARIPVRVSAP
ncbi:hypothetical protein THASP1DRAFT_28977 [Thamnocephalis sphaerospora]|uniref:Pentacotripeptide-repeat region of PRORP domain-containing protein n=1 Tax=Thamnocephalis sphaerospora TaxID=78915 RepID=A0A4P9XSV2_9FUNG|nr:hypothetical protein THASP1DRAFT_28977 [Thamnocephalis sphaerospora]|eukprot:RKP09224.1 hypothetical protein THASP1DRAFT_28977 [Thamnocephalis sphaerospora]